MRFVTRIQAHLVALVNRVVSTTTRNVTGTIRGGVQFVPLSRGWSFRFSVQPHVVDGGGTSGTKDKDGGDGTDDDTGTDDGGDDDLDADGVDTLEAVGLAFGPQRVGGGVIDANTVGDTARVGGEVNAFGDGVDATQLWFTGVFSTRIPIVTVDSSEGAGSVVLHFSECTQIVVVAVCQLQDVGWLRGNSIRASRNGGR